MQRLPAAQGLQGQRRLAQRRLFAGAGALTLAVILTFNAVSWTTLSSALIAPIIGAVFILPFFLLSGLSGEIADRIDKARLARIVKVWEIVMMLVAVGGFALHSFWILLAVVFGMGMHSTLFGPIKYSIIPQHMHSNELIGANALIESGTFGNSYEQISKYRTLSRT